jgi:ABC-type transport system involved in multi-copper enzyme maturation permease subunit
VTLAIVGVRKFWTRSATIVSLIIAVLLVSLLIVLEGVGYRQAIAQGGVDPSSIEWVLTFPGAFDAVIALTFSFIGIISLIYIATAAGSEWSWGTLKVAVARGQSRWKYTVSTYASMAVIMVLGLVITFIAGVIAVFLGASIAGLQVGNPFDTAVLGRISLELIRCAVALISLGSVGYAVTMVAKSQMAGIGTVIGYFLASLIGPAFLPDFVKEIFKYLPFSISSDAIGMQGPPVHGVTSSASLVDPNLALLITVAWLVGLLAVAAVSVERTEIAG